MGIIAVIVTSIVVASPVVIALHTVIAVISVKETVVTAPPLVLVGIVNLFAPLLADASRHSDAPQRMIAFPTSNVVAAPLDIVIATDRTAVVAIGPIVLTAARRPDISQHIIGRSTVTDTIIILAATIDITAISTFPLPLRVRLANGLLVESSLCPSLAPEGGGVGGGGAAASEHRIALTVTASRLTAFLPTRLALPISSSSWAMPIIAGHSRVMKGDDASSLLHIPTTTINGSHSFSRCGSGGVSGLPLRVGCITTHT